MHIKKEKEKERVGEREYAIRWTHQSLASKKQDN